MNSNQWPVRVIEGETGTWLEDAQGGVVVNLSELVHRANNYSPFREALRDCVYALNTRQGQRIFYGKHALARAQAALAEAGEIE